MQMHLNEDEIYHLDDESRSSAGLSKIFARVYVD